MDFDRRIALFIHTGVLIFKGPVRKVKHRLSECVGHHSVGRKQSEQINDMLNSLFNQMFTDQSKLCMHWVLSNMFKPNVSEEKVLEKKLQRISQIWGQLQYDDDKFLFIKSFEKICSLELFMLEFLYKTCKLNPQESSLVFAILYNNPEQIAAQIKAILEDPSPKAASRRVSVVSGCDDLEGVALSNDEISHLRLTS